MKKDRKATQKETATHRSEVSHHRQLPRLNRIEGQVRGLQKMIEAERDCLDIVHQISAIISALRRVQGDMLRDHLATLGETIVAENLPAHRRRELADRLGALLKEL